MAIINAGSFGSFWSGHANQFETSLQYKVAPHFQTGITLEQTFARLREGHFVAKLFVLRADYSVSPLLTFFNLVRFDKSEDEPRLAKQRPLDSAARR